MPKNNLKNLLDGYQSGFSLHQEFYTGGEVFENEIEAIFKTQWIYVGNTAQLKKAGDYFLYRIVNEVVIIIKGNNGEVYAHFNTCTHRGSAICLQEEGNAPKLVCPYHQWVFDKDGSLLNARMMPGDFCKAEYHLRSLPVQLVDGLIFISMSANPPSAEAMKTSLSPYLRPYQIPTSKVAAIKNYTLSANWKLVAENFRECYHCGGAHPEYCQAVIGANLKDDTTALVKEKNREWQSAGLETQLKEVVPGTTTYAIRYPLRPGVESYSIDGKKVSIPMGSHIDYNAGVVGLVNYPNFWMDAVSDYVWIMRVTPVNSATTDVQFCWLVDEKAKEGVDYNLENLLAFWEITGDQDGQLCENNFKGILTSGYRPGPYTPVEDQVVNFVDWCIGKLKEHVENPNG